jgi:hypothetical protein
VFLVFGSRRGLFDALGADLLERGGFDRVLAAAEHPDAREALRGSIRAVTAMYAAHRDVLRALHSMALLDPDAVGGSIQRMEKRRAGGMAYLARRLSEQRMLRPDASTDEAAHVLWLLTSFDSFDLLYTGGTYRPTRLIGQCTSRASAVMTSISAVRLSPRDPHHSAEDDSRRAHHYSLGRRGRRHANQSLARVRRQYVDRLASPPLTDHLQKPTMRTCEPWQHSKSTRALSDAH